MQQTLQPRDVTEVATLADALAAVRQQRVTIPTHRAPFDRFSIPVAVHSIVLQGLPVATRPMTLCSERGSGVGAGNGARTKWNSRATN